MLVTDVNSVATENGTQSGFDAVAEFVSNGHFRGRVGNLGNLVEPPVAVWRHHGYLGLRFLDQICVSLKVLAVRAGAGRLDVGPSPEVRKTAGFRLGFSSVTDEF